MFAAGDLVAGVAGDAEHNADDEDDESQRPEDRNLGDEANDQQHKSEKNHGVLLSDGCDRG
jgi:hypothetical protein